MSGTFLKKISGGTIVKSIRSICFSKNSSTASLFLKIRVSPLLILCTIIIGLSIPYLVYAGNTYATWNPSDKSTNTTLSNGNLTAKNTAGSNAYNGVRSTLSKTSGKWYWEIKLDAMGGDGAVNFGVITSSASIAASEVAGQWMYIIGQGGYSWCNNVESGTPAGGAVNDVVGFAYNADNATVDFYLNNTFLFQCTGVTTGSFAYFTGYDVNDQVTANFGGTTLKYTPPSGFNAGLYTSGSKFQLWPFSLF